MQIKYDELMMMMMMMMMTFAIRSDIAMLNARITFY